MEIFCTIIIIQNLCGYCNMKKQTKKCRTQKRKRGGKRKTLKKRGGNIELKRTNREMDVLKRFEHNRQKTREHQGPLQKQTNGNKSEDGDYVVETVNEPDEESQLEQLGSTWSDNPKFITRYKPQNDKATALWDVIQKSKLNVNTGDDLNKLKKDNKSDIITLGRVQNAIRTGLFNMNETTPLNLTTDIVKDNFDSKMGDIKRLLLVGNKKANNYNKVVEKTMKEMGIINDLLDTLSKKGDSDVLEDVIAAKNQITNIDKHTKNTMEKLIAMGETTNAKDLREKYIDVSNKLLEKIVTINNKKKAAAEKAAAEKAAAEKAAAEKAAAVKAKTAVMKELKKKAAEKAAEKAEEEARKEAAAKEEARKKAVAEEEARKKAVAEEEAREKAAAEKAAAEKADKNQLALTIIPKDRPENANNPKCNHEKVQYKNIIDDEGKCKVDKKKGLRDYKLLQNELNPNCTRHPEHEKKHNAARFCFEKNNIGEPYPPAVVTKTDKESQQPTNIPEVKQNNQGNLLKRFGKTAAATAVAVGNAVNAIIPKRKQEDRVVIRNPEPDVDTRDIVVPEYTQQYIKQNPDNLPRYDATPTDAQPLVRYEEPQPPIQLNKEDEEDEEVEVESTAIVNTHDAFDTKPTVEEQSYVLTLLSNPVKNMQQIASQISDALVVVPNKPDAPNPKQTTPPARFYKSMRPATETLIRKNLDNGLIAMMEYMEQTPTRDDYSDSAYARFEKKTATGKDTWDIDIRQTGKGYKYIMTDSTGKYAEAYRTGDDADRKIRIAVRNEIMKRLKDGYVPANTTRKLKDRSNNKDIAETRRLYRNRKGVYESSYKPTSTKQTTASRRTRKLRSNRIARKHIADSAKIDEKREKLAAEQAAKKKKAEQAANNTDANQ